MAEFEHNSATFGYIDLDDLEGVQNGLTKLGYDPGVVDGKDGPNTQRAVREFQAAASIKIDGIVGPVTRGALRDELQRRADEAEGTETPTATS
ncbi:MAG: peptidoglycan-binding protein [Deltaproteobacteria bacterium]|nr:peptidoglycan-binding protein [Deltaproteobacteria bacterium]